MLLQISSIKSHAGRDLKGLTIVFSKIWPLLLAWCLKRAWALKSEDNSKSWSCLNNVNSVKSQSLGVYFLICKIGVIIPTTQFYWRAIWVCLFSVALFLDSTYKNYPSVFFFFCLIYFTKYNIPQAHSCCWKRQYFTLL